MQGVQSWKGDAGLIRRKLCAPLRGIQEGSAGQAALAASRYYVNPPTFTTQCLALVAADFLGLRLRFPTAPLCPSSGTRCIPSVDHLATLYKRLSLCLCCQSYCHQYYNYYYYYFYYHNCFLLLLFPSTTTPFVPSWGPLILHHHLYTVVPVSCRSPKLPLYSSTGARE